MIIETIDKIIFMKLIMYFLIIIYNKVTILLLKLLYKYNYTIIEIYEIFFINLTKEKINLDI